MAALELGREDEALVLADESTASAAVDDVEPRALSKLVRAHVLARRGEPAAADEHLAAAAALVESTDYMALHLALDRARAEVSRLSGRRDQEREALERAMAIADRKGHALAAERARDQLACL